MVHFRSKRLTFPGILYLVFLSFSLHAQQMERIPPAEFTTTYQQPVDVQQVGEHHYFIDFGKAYFGTVVIRSSSGQSQQLTVHLGEKTRGPARIDRDPGGTIRYQLVQLHGLEAGVPAEVELIPYKRNTQPPAIILPDSFGVVLPFRYCELENLQVPFENIEIMQKGYHYRFNEEASAFSSSDTLLDRIWDLCKHSIKATSFTGYYIDGDRERIPYEGDAFINQLSHYVVDSVYSIARRTNLYFLNNPTWPTEWILHIVPLFYNDFLYTGDLSVLKKNYDELKIRTLLALAREDGLISSHSDAVTEVFLRSLGFDDPNTRIRDLVDWPPAQKDTGWKLATAEGERDGYDMVAVNTVVNAFHYRNLVLMERIAGYLGKIDDVAFYSKRAAKVRQAINEKLFDRERGVYVDGEGSGHASLHANMIPLAFDLVPEQHLETVIQHILSRGMACSVYGAQYLLEGLYKHGAADEAMALMTATAGDRNWWNMIESGSTITMEAWDIKYKPNLDWNHAWGAAPANIIVRYTWGIRPAAPGFTCATIQPQLTGLTASSIKVPTMQGAIEADFGTRNHKEWYTISIPEGMSAEFLVPPGAATIKLNGKKIRGNAALMLPTGTHGIRIRKQ
jgi:alpha-L-rhamnosidase